MSELLSKGKCLKCVNLATKTTQGKGHFLIWCCKKMKEPIGNTTDMRSGNNVQKNCKEYEAIKWQT